MDTNINPDFEIGEKVGFFKIYEIEKEEIIAGENDKHLNFRASILKETKDQTKVTVSTIVKYNNKFGRFYMTLIAPFYKIIVKSILKSAAISLNDNSQA